MDEMRDGMETAWDRVGRVRWRAPWTYRRSWKPAWSANPWAVGAMVAAAIVGIAAFFYFRKRRQVADSYTMGGQPGEAGSPESLNGRGMASVDGASRRSQPA